MSFVVFDERACRLGEGALWHPLSETLFWFDIKGRRLLARGSRGATEWSFDEMHSAAGWIDHDHLLLASETGLWRFSTRDGRRSKLCPLEADNPLTRSNDGRADPYGGFWIGTMGKNAEAGAGSIWRWYRGELRRLFSGITIPNAICFTPDRRFGYFTDTVTARVMKVALDDEGWPQGEAGLFLDLVGEGLNPDGAVVDADGAFWVAQWGASRIACYDGDGGFRGAVSFPATQISCPAFGGKDFGTLYCTSAFEGLDQSADPRNGMTFAATGWGPGQREHQVRLTE